MRKKENWFRLDYGFYNDPALKRLIEMQGSKAIGVYMVVISLIYENGGYITDRQSKILEICEITGEPENIVRQILNQCLMDDNKDKKRLLVHHKTDGILTSDRVDRELEFSKSRVQKQTEAGLKGAKKRYGKDYKQSSDPNSLATSDPNSLAKQNSENKSKSNPRLPSWVAIGQPIAQYNTLHNDTLHDNVRVSVIQEDQGDVKPYPLTGPALVAAIAETDYAYSPSAAMRNVWGSTENRDKWLAEFLDAYPISKARESIASCSKVWNKLEHEERCKAMLGLERYADEFEVDKPEEYLANKFWEQLTN